MALLVNHQRVLKAVVGSTNNNNFTHITLVSGYIEEMYDHALFI